MYYMLYIHYLLALDLQIQLNFRCLRSRDYTTWINFELRISCRMWLRLVDIWYDLWIIDHSRLNVSIKYFSIEYIVQHLASYLAKVFMRTLLYIYTIVYTSLQVQYTTSAIEIRYTIINISKLPHDEILWC